MIFYKSTDFYFYYFHVFFFIRLTILSIISIGILLEIAVLCIALIVLQKQ
ncbi:hypothetical protein [uncultured Gammaproteobacteria bacterium]|nr:hypothetical protein [uncultured Gammaproteobacteria bacterium]